MGNAIEGIVLIHFFNQGLDENMTKTVFLPFKGSRVYNDVYWKGLTTR